MCLACEEQEMLFRYYIERALAAGAMPEGVTVEELEAMGYERPPGVKKSAASKSSPTLAPANAFVCDSPDGE
jgi:hypothetical protein